MSDDKQNEASSATLTMGELLEVSLQVHLMQHDVGHLYRVVQELAASDVYDPQAERLLHEIEKAVIHFERRLRAFRALLGDHRTVQIISGIEESVNK
jgi:hypothetical protein